MFLDPLYKAISKVKNGCDCEACLVLHLAHTPIYVEMVACLEERVVICHGLFANTNLQKPKHGIEKQCSFFPNKECGPEDTWWRIAAAYMIRDIVSNVGLSNMALQWSRRHIVEHGCCIHGKRNC